MPDANAKEACPTCGGTNFSWDGSCGGELAKCLDCGRMVSPKEMIQAEEPTK